MFEALKRLKQFVVNKKKKNNKKKLRKNCI